MSAQTSGAGEKAGAALPGAGAPDPAGGLPGPLPGGFCGAGGVARQPDGPAPAAAPDGADGGHRLPGRLFRSGGSPVRSGPHPGGAGGILHPSVRRGGRSAGERRRTTPQRRPFKRSRTFSTGRLGSQSRRPTIFAWIRSQRTGLRCRRQLHRRRSRRNRRPRRWERSSFGRITQGLLCRKTTPWTRSLWGSFRR